MYKALIPKNLDVDQLIETHSVENIPGFHKDKVCAMCHLIYSQFKTLDENGYHPEKAEPYFVPLSSKIIKELIGNSYNLIISWMNEAGIIMTDESWSTGVVSKGYRITDEYLIQDVRWVEIELYMLERKSYPIRKGRKNKNSKQQQFPFQPRVIGHLKKFFTPSRLTVDCRCGLELIEAKYQDEIAEIGTINNHSRRKEKQILAQINRSNAILSLQALKDGEYSISQDSFGYRLHTPITRLNREFRGLLKYDGKDLVQIDLSNSQLFFSTYLLDHRNYAKNQKDGKKYFRKEIWKDSTLSDSNTEHNTIMFLKSLETRYRQGLQDCPFFRNVCNGGIYESIVDELDKKNYFPDDWSSVDKRNKVKKYLLMQIFADENSSKNSHQQLFKNGVGEIWRSFERLNPEVAQLFKEIKKVDYKTLCRLLQRLESVAMLGFVVKYLYKNRPDIPVFTLHDCLVVPIDYVDSVKAILLQQVEAFMGFKPKVSVSSWSSNNGTGIVESQLLFTSYPACLDTSTWASVLGYEGYYEISTSGQIRSLDRSIVTASGERFIKGKLLRAKNNGYGYKFVLLCKDGIKRCGYIHRLVAQAFHPNPENKPQVNHINGDKEDNTVQNLEWVTPSENSMHAYETGLYFNIGKVKRFTRAVFDKRTLKYYPTAKEAANDLGKNYSSLRGMLKGRRRNSTFLEYMQCCTHQSPFLVFPKAIAARKNVNSLHSKRCRTV